MKVFNLYCPIYAVPIMLFVGGTKFEAAKVFGRAFKLPAPDPEQFRAEAAGSVFFNESCKAAAIWFPQKEVCTGIIAHEATHAALLIFDQSSVNPPKWNHDEHFTYYVGWLVDMLCEKLTPIRRAKPPRGAKSGAWY